MLIVFYLSERCLQENIFLDLKNMSENGFYKEPIK